jgi:hypothetical protein
VPRKACDEMVKTFETELKELARSLPESLMGDKGETHQERRPTEANGCSTRDPLIP